MYCETRKHPGCGCHAGLVQPHGASCACECGPHSWRRFQTQAERVGRLERYLGELQQEAQAVEERIAALKGA